MKIKHINFLLDDLKQQVKIMKDGWKNELY